MVLVSLAGGMVLQTNMSDILARIEDQNRLVKQEVSDWQATWSDSGRLNGGKHEAISKRISFQAGLSAAPAAVVHQLKSMNIPQQIKDMKLPDLPQAIKVMSHLLDNPVGVLPKM